MARTPTQFKKAFEAYMKKPEGERNEHVEAALRTSSETAEQAKTDALKARDEIRAELTELTKGKDLPKEVAAKGRELDKELGAAMKRQDFAAAREIQAEIKALVTDAVGTTETALKDLMTERAAKAEAANEALGFKSSTESPPDLPPPEKGKGPKLSAEKRGEIDKANKGLSDLMAKRGEAIDWQQDEIRAVNKAVAEQKRLAGIWTKLLEGINEKRAEATASLEAKAETDRKLKSETEAEAEELQLKKESEEELAKAPEEKKERWRNAIKNSDEAIGKIKQNQAALTQEQAGHPKLIADAQKALDDAVDAAQATLLKEAASIAEAAKTAAPKAAPKKGMKVKNPDELVANLGLDMTPQLDTAALKDVGKPIDGKTMGIEKVFPQLNLVAEKHGTGRHAAQTGLDRQAGRTRSGLSPDQPGDEGGIGKADEAQPIRLEGTHTASAFLSPELEKLAVDTAIRLVSDQCKWTEYEDGGSWKKLTNIMVRLGTPAGKPGWGVAISRIDGDGKTDPKEVKAALDEFHNGKISFDAMLKKLNAKVGGGAKADGVHVEANFVPGVAVVLNRTGGGWINTTQFPVPAENLGWDLKDKKVRKDDKSPEESAPALVTG